MTIAAIERIQQRVDEESIHYTSREHKEFDVQVDLKDGPVWIRFEDWQRALDGGKQE